MIWCNDGDPKRVQHFINDNGFAKLIGVSENLSSNNLYVLDEDI